MTEFDWNDEDLTEEFKAYRAAIVQGARTILRDEADWNGKIRPNLSVSISYISREPIALAVSRLVSETLYHKL
jgi:hypothetical protein